jgi:hypothetical protein
MVGRGWPLGHASRPIGSKTHAALRVEYCRSLQAIRNAGLGQYARSYGWMRETTGHAFYQRVVLMIKVLRILRYDPPFPNLPFPRSSPCAVPLHGRHGASTDLRLQHCANGAGDDAVRARTLGVHGGVGRSI